MSNLYLSILQGTVAGGTAAYLHTCAKDEARQESSNAWTYAALQVNHLFLLTAETMYAMGVSLGRFGPCVQITYTLTPLVLFIPLLAEKLSPFEKSAIETFSSFYKTAVFTASLAALTLGNTPFAMSAIGMLALDCLVQKEMAKWIFMQATKICALSAFIGYGEQVTLSKSPIAPMARVSAAVMWLKLCVIDAIQSIASCLNTKRDSSWEQDRYEYRERSFSGWSHCCDWHPYEGYGYSTGTAFHGASFCRPSSVW